MEEPEAMAEEDERQAGALFRTGLETALQAQEIAVDSTAPYKEGEGPAEEEAADKEATRATAIATKAHAATEKASRGTPRRTEGRR